MHRRWLAALEFICILWRTCDQMDSEAGKTDGGVLPEFTDEENKEKLRELGIQFRYTCERENNPLKDQPNEKGYGASRRGGVAYRIVATTSVLSILE